MITARLIVQAKKFSKTRAIVVKGLEDHLELRSGQHEDLRAESLLACHHASTIFGVVRKNDLPSGDLTEEDEAA